jgi:pimeloyl-ACP methyl ester carboxylesterase
MHRVDADPDRVGILLPGGGYTTAMPLLFFARSLLQAHRWTTVGVDWEPPADFGRSPGWVGDQLAGVLDTARADRVVVVGKSLGSLAALWTDSPAVWLTPLLARDERGLALDALLRERRGVGMVEAIARSQSPALLIGGTADPWWDGEQARLTGKEVLEVDGAGHGMEHDRDPRRSVETLGRVVAAIDDFVASLG